METDRRCVGRVPFLSIRFRGRRLVLTRRCSKNAVGETDQRHLRIYRFGVAPTACASHQQQLLGRRP